MLNLTNARRMGTLVIDKNLTESLHLTRISSVGRALDCRAGGRGFDSRAWPYQYKGTPFALLLIWMTTRVKWRSHLHQNAYLKKIVLVFKC